MVWSSDYDAVEIGGTTLHEMVVGAARRFADRPALIDGGSGQTVPYGTLAARIDRVAAGLAEGGFGSGDVLALWAPNLPQWAGVALGAMAAGGAVTGVNPTYTEREVREQLADSGASILVTVPSLLPAARRVAASTDVREVVVLGAGEGATSILELIETDAPAPESQMDPETATALLPYSSGTTGLPKGVILTHSNLVTAIRQANRGLRVTERDTMVAVAPYFHVMGFVLKLALPLAAGATVVTMARFDLEQFLELIQRHRATVIVGAPPLITALARHPLVDSYDLSGVEVIVAGGAPLGADVQRAVAARFPHSVAGQGWGLTETSVGVSIPDRTSGTLPGSVGRLMANTELRVVDNETGCDLGVGESGELWMRGPQVMAGYLNRPDATREMIDERGWLHTGDLGYVDEGGNVFIVERLKELIKVSGYQVAPAELEALLITHPRIADVAVVRRADDRYGEVPVAMVVARGDLSADDLMDWIAERVAPHKKIRAVQFVDAIPRTASGKILRRLLAEDRANAKAREPVAT